VKAPPRRVRARAALERGAAGAAGDRCLQSIQMQRIAAVAAEMEQHDAGSARRAPQARRSRGCLPPLAASPDPFQEPLHKISVGNCAMSCVEPPRTRSLRTPGRRWTSAGRGVWTWRPATAWMLSSSPSACRGAPLGSERASERAGGTVFVPPSLCASHRDVLYCSMQHSAGRNGLSLYSMIPPLRPRAQAAAEAAGPPRRAPADQPGATSLICAISCGCL
jgi:hypothetical protein